MSYILRTLRDILRTLVLMGRPSFLRLSGLLPTTTRFTLITTTFDYFAKYLFGELLVRMEESVGADGHYWRSFLGGSPQMP